MLKHRTLISIIAVLVVIGGVVTYLLLNRKTSDPLQPPTVKQKADEIPTGIPAEIAQERELQPSVPITDIAPSPTKKQEVTRRHIPKTVGKAVIKDQSTKLPVHVMNLTAPPQWTQTLARPAANPVPPDPLTPPEIYVNPERVLQPDIPRLSPGVQVPVKP